MNNVELIRSYKLLQREQEEFSELLKVAFSDFRKCSLRILIEEIQPAWMKICDWSCKDRQAPSFTFDAGDEALLKSAFLQVSEARINRDEFDEIMEPFIQKVSDYKCEFSNSLRKKEQAVSKAYTNHFSSCAEYYEPFFSMPQVKNIIISFLQEE